MNQADLFAASMPRNPSPQPGNRSAGDRGAPPPVSGAQRLPRAHRGDPQSSHDAARRAEAFAQTHAETVLRGLRAYPLSTSAELARAMPFDLTETRRRLDDLKRDERARRIDPTPETVPCAVSGKRVCRWEAV